VPSGAGERSGLYRTARIRMRSLPFSPRGAEGQFQGYRLGPRDAYAALRGTTVVPQSSMLDTSDVCEIPRPLRASTGEP